MPLNMLTRTPRVRDDDDQERFRDQLAILGTVVYALPDAATLTDATTGEIVLANPAAEALFGYAPGTLAGTPAEQLVPEGDRAATRALIDEFRNTGSNAIIAAGRTAEVVVQQQDGTARVFELSTSGLPDPNGHPRYLLVVDRDITERRYAEAQREGLLRMTRRLASQSEPNTVLQALQDEVLLLFEGDLVTVRRWDAPSERLVVVATNIGPLETIPSVPLGVGLVGDVARQQRPVVITDLHRAYGPETMYPGAGIQAGVGVPLLHDGRLLATLVVVTRRPQHQFTQREVDILEVLSSVAAAILASLSQARLAGVLLAARTLAHEVNNELALTVGYTDLLAQTPGLPADLLELVEEASRGAQRASATVDQLGRTTSLEEVDLGAPGGAVLDLGRSTT